jgi:4-oxalocrotonate tautomerase
MPIVRVDLFEGRSREQKRELARGITEVVARTCGVSPDGVHVLITERTRENWARGSVLHVDRPRVAGAGTRMLAGDFVVVSQGVAPQATSGRSSENLGHLAARGLDGKGDLAISTWSSEDAWRTGADGTGTETGCDRLDLPDGGGLRAFPMLTRHLTMSTHEVRPEKVDEYIELRRIAVNPGMARLHGFVSSDILRKRELPNAFFVVNQWLTKEDSDRYTGDALHTYLKSHVRPLLISHSGTRDFEVLTQAPD